MMYRFYVYLQRDIPAGMELRYSYGDAKNINLQWRNNAKFFWFFWETLFALFQQMFVADDIGNKLRYRQLY